MKIDLHCLKLDCVVDFTGLGRTGLIGLLICYSGMD